MDNVQVIRLGYEAFARGEIEPILASLAPDVIWRVAGTEANAEAMTFRGPDGVRRFFEQLDAEMTFDEFRACEYVGSGDRVYVLGTMTVRRHDGSPAESSHFVHLYTLRNGRIVDFEEFVDQAAIDGVVARVKSRVTS